MKAAPWPVMVAVPGVSLGLNLWLAGRAGLGLDAGGAASAWYIGGLRCRA